MTGSPLSNIPLTARLFSIKMMVAIITIVFTSSGVWFALTAKVEASDAAIKSIKTEQRAQGADIQTIKTDIAVILERQKAASARATEQQKQTQRILDIVQTKLVNGARHSGGD